VIAASARPFGDPLQLILEIAFRVSPADHIVLMQAFAEPAEVVILAAAGSASAWRFLRAPLAPGLVVRAIETRETQLGADPTNAPVTPAVVRHLVVPLILDDRVFGVLQATEGPRARFRRHDAKLLRAFGDECLIAIRTASGPERTA
jgi:GAF domain-containing protein